MKSINWTRRLAELPDDEVPPPLDPDIEQTKERPSVTQEVLDRDELRDSAEHRVLRNIARTYARYYGPQKPD